MSKVISLILGLMVVSAYAQEGTYSFKVEISRRSEADIDRQNVIKEDLYCELTLPVPSEELGTITCKGQYGQKVTLTQLPLQAIVLEGHGEVGRKLWSMSLSFAQLMELANRASELAGDFSADDFQCRSKKEVDVAKKKVQLFSAIGPVIWQNIRYYQGQSFFSFQRKNEFLEFAFQTQYFPLEIEGGH